MSEITPETGWNAEAREQFYADVERSFTRLEDEPDDRTDGRQPASLTEKAFRPSDRMAAGQTPDLALEEDILGRFRADLRLAGVAGEERLASLTYLALTSRVLPWGRPAERPVSAIAKGTTSTGKSHTTRTVLRFFPPEAFIDLGSMSRRFLFYDEQPYSHRFIVVPEWASIADDDELVALLRTLLSEGRIVHGTVEGEGKRSARRIEKEGPTGLLVTTTEGFTDPELETRCLSLSTDDTPEQTRRVFGVFADQEEEVETAVNFEAWQDFQTWIAAHGETRVFVPFLRALSELMPIGATRLRRDFVSLVCLVRAHAILYQAQRERDQHGRIVAIVQGDYEPVRALVADLIAEGVEASVPELMRETVEAVRRLIHEDHSHPNPKAIADALGIGRSATYDRVRDALRRGYLINAAQKSERGMKLELGTDLPAASEDFLPSSESVVRSLSGRPSGQTFGSVIGLDERLSGCPADPPGVREYHDAEIERLAEVAGSSAEQGATASTLGDAAYLDYVAVAHRNGLVTTAEALELERIHLLVLDGGNEEF